MRGKIGNSSEKWEFGNARSLRWLPCSEGKNRPKACGEGKFQGKIGSLESGNALETLQVMENGKMGKIEKKKNLGMPGAQNGCPDLVVRAYSKKNVPRAACEEDSREKNETLEMLGDQEDGNGWEL